MLPRMTIAMLAALAWSSAARAVLTVNDPMPITDQVTVQIIRTAWDSGTPQATVFGNDKQHVRLYRYPDLGF